MLFLSNCKKEKEIIYYENVIGERWLATRNPIVYAVYMLPYEQLDFITTDKNGHFICRFAKSIKLPNHKAKEEVNCYELRLVDLGETCTIFPR